MSEFPHEAFLRHIAACNNAVLPGRRVRVILGGRPVGFALPEHAPTAPLPDAVAFDAHLAGLARVGAFRPRHELFDVRDEATGHALAAIDRGAIPLLGTLADGVHMNGLVRRPDGIHLWVARRAPNKKLDPGKLDHIVAGGVPRGLGPRETLVKEAWEEASLTPDLVAKARPEAVLAYAIDRAEGLRRDRIHVYDLWLPEGVTPRPNDDEVAGFDLWPISAVLESVARTEDFKFNVNLVLIDLFLRLGVIDPAGATGRRAAMALQPLRGRHGSA